MAYDRLLRHRDLRSQGTFLVTFCCATRRPWLANNDAAAAVAIAIASQERAGHCHNHAWVLMPDHVHWLLSLAGSRPISKVVGGCKAVSSRVIQQCIGINRSPWQDGYHDHRLRDDEDLRRQARYLIANPLRAGLVTRMTDYRWWYFEWGSTAALDPGEDLSGTHW